MLRSRRIAIILPDTLQSIGLQHLLTDYFPPVEVTCFSSFVQSSKENGDSFDFYFTCSDYFVLYADFFIPRRNKTMILSEEKASPSVSGNAGFNLYTKASRETIIEELQLLFDNENNTHPGGENSKELSSREIDVLQLIVKGITNKEIADKLNISLNTVLTHRKNITAKLGIKTVSGLTFYAIMNGFISGEEIEL